MADVLRKPTRAQLSEFIPDQHSVRAFETLFDATSFVPGDVVYSGTSTRSGALLANGAAVARLLYPKLYFAIVRLSEVTISIASPGVVTWTSNGLANNAPVVFSTNGTLPVGLTVGTTYYVKSVAADTFQCSATPGGAAINTSGTQSGSHTATAFPFGNGDGSTTFNVPTVAAVGGCNAFIVY